MKITHTAGIIDTVTGEEVYCELVRNMIDGSSYVGEETLKITVACGEGAGKVDIATVSARQVLDFLEGSGMT